MLPMPAVTGTKTKITAMPNDLGMQPQSTCELANRAPTELITLNASE